MDIKQLKRFLDLCQTGSFTKTAENLFLSQQALSSSMNTLEEELGKPLFKRTSKGVIPTQEGLLLHQLCKPVVETFDEMTQELERRINNKRRQVFFGLAPDVLQASSPDLILQFRMAHPNFDVKGIESTDIACMENVVNGKVDFSFCPRPHDDSATEFIPLGQERLYAVVNKNSPLSRKKALSIQDLKGESLVSLNGYYQIHYQIQRCCKANGFVPHFLVETGEPGILLSMVKLNSCVFICTEHITTGMERESCVKIPISDEDMIWEYGLVYKKGKQLDHNAKLFMDYLIKNAQRQPKK